MQEAREHLAFALGGEAGARLARVLGLLTSPDTRLRVIRRSPEPQEFPIRVGGVDDWAWRKGHRDGTILVDLERHRMADRRPERSAERFPAWLRTHPSVAVISRDRGEEYAVVAKLGAGHAVPVADRFHRLKNRGETMERVLERHRHLLQRVPLPGSQAPLLAPPRADREAARARTSQQTRECFSRIQALADTGLSQRAIARTTGLSRGTVRAYLTVSTPPQRPQVTKHASILTS